LGSALNSAIISTTHPPFIMEAEINVLDYKVYQPPLVMGQVDTLFNDYIKEECFKLQADKDKDDSRRKLAGNLREEVYIFADSEFEKSVQSVIEAAFLDRFNQNQRDFGYPELEQEAIEWLPCWVNYQKKYECNPIHTHTGKYSFVWWVQIPFDIEEEFSLEHVKESNSPCASLFQWNYFTLNSTKMLQNNVPLTKGVDDGRFFIFPANLPHQVYPFYTSDDYRISISGNFDFTI